MSPSATACLPSLRMCSSMPGRTSSPGQSRPPPVAVRARRYPTRKAIAVPMAAAITGLSESTIKRLDKDPKNTNYPGRNATAKMLAAWAKMYKWDKLAAREVRAANRPCIGHGRS